MSASKAGLVMSVGAVGSGSLIFCARPLLTRFGARTLCAAGAAIFSVSMLLFAFVSRRGYGDVLLAQALRGAGTGLLYVGMNGFAFETLPDEDLATSASLFYLLRQLGGSIGVALTAQVLDANRGAGMTAVFFALAATAPLSLMPMRLRQEPVRSPAQAADKAAAGIGPAPEAM
jgi:MFS family permease